MVRIRMKPDIVSFYRTPGAFKFCRRINAGPTIDYFHECNRGKPLPEHIIRQVFSNLNRRDLISAMRTSKWLYTVGSACLNWEHVDLFNRTIMDYSLVALLNRRVKVIRMADTNVETSSLTYIFPPLLCPLLVTHLDLSRAVFANPSLLITLLRGCDKLVVRINFHNFLSCIVIQFYQAFLITYDTELVIIRVLNDFLGSITRKSSVGCTK
uniref:F-box domain-containing protein n=1 Tax=Heterorhabditis bacteriophora TaxID=37862 RepID=A0A1I7W630_HETBA